MGKRRMLNQDYFKLDANSMRKTIELENLKSTLRSTKVQRKFGKLR